MFVNIVMLEEFVGKGCGSMSDKNNLISIACNPEQSAVIEACAGSGKTWLLISRIFRLLLSGIAPHEILAITFTRKAAQEMRDRLEKILIDFTKFDDCQIREELLMRGVTEAEIDSFIPLARGLFEKVLSNPQEISIDTFHGWFSKISQAAPLTSELNIQGVIRDDQARMMQEAMESWWEKLGRGEGEFADLKLKYLDLLKIFSSSALNELIVGKSSLMQQKATWDLFENHCLEQQLSIAEVLQRQFPRATKSNPLEDLYHESRFDWNGLQLAADFLVFGAKRDIEYAATILQIIAKKQSNVPIDEVIPLLKELFFTKDKVVKIRNDFTKVSTTIKAHLKKEKQEHLELAIVAIYERWIEQIADYMSWAIEAELLAVNLSWVELATSASEHYLRYKQNNRLLDFSDFEYNAFRLMSDEKTAIYLQERLDAKYKHILIDEFQDTNPLQWQILKAWLDGYQGASQKPFVFLVGDPKQSIYRFRRADARLFELATQYLNENFRAKPFDHSTTRRNPQEVVDVVNALFNKVKEEITDYPYKKHETLWKNPNEGYITPKVFRLPLIARAQLPTDDLERNSLKVPMVDRNMKVDSIQSEEEIQQIGRLILHWCKTEWVATGSESEPKYRRPHLGDFLILVRVKKHLQVIEKVFNQLGILCDTPRTGGLLQSLEALDILALLKTLLIPANNLTLAHVLRSPIFSCTEQDLEALALYAKHHQKNWWTGLQLIENERLKNAFQILNAWKDLAKFLPVHDLLDRIYHEGHILQVYASTSHELIRAKVLANLEAFLLLALDTNAGRYPSLSRFIEELEILSKGDLQESPDEGEMQEDVSEQDEAKAGSSVEDARFVRVMTIHSAKGLEAPFVFLTNANTKNKSAESSGILFDWPLGENTPKGVCIYKSKPSADFVTNLMKIEEGIAEKENWNLLYVALTRAKQCVVVTGLGKESTVSNPSLVHDGSWYSYLMSTGMRELSLDDALDQSKVCLEHDVPKVNDAEVVETTDTLVAFPVLPTILTGVTPEMQSQLMDERKKSSVSYAQELGTAIHLILERHLNEAHQRRTLATLPDIKTLQNWLQIDSKVMLDAFEIAQTMLSQPHLLNFFDPNLYINAWNELALIDETGSLLKVDRLVELNEKLVILDYKLNIPDPGTDSMNQYETQLKRYADQISKRRPDKNVEAYLIDQKGNIFFIEL